MIVNSNEAEVERHYKFGRTLGQGTFATVKMATCLSDNTKWAVKIIKRSALTSEDEESLKMEIQILQLTNHPNIVSVKEVFYCKNYVYLVMDLMTGGELFDRIVTKDHYSEQEAKLALSQIVMAVKYCHEKNIVHRDLKPENILYQSTEENSALKLADFGLATLLRPNQLMNVACGTPGYVAPEILKGIAYGKEVDMWSVGVILYILLCGFPPFYDDNNKKLFAQIVNANYSFPDPYWTNISATAKDLVRKLLVVDPRQRLSALQVLAHPWMFEDGSGSSLDHFRPNLKSYNARRRFRSAIRAVQITQLLRKKAGVAAPASILEAVEQQDNAMRSKSIDNSEIKDPNQQAGVTESTSGSHRQAGTGPPGNKMEIIPEVAGEAVGASSACLNIEGVAKEGSTTGTATTTPTTITASTLASAAVPTAPAVAVASTTAAATVAPIVTPAPIVTVPGKSSAPGDPVSTGSGALKLNNNGASQSSTPTASVRSKGGAVKSH
eukprot:gene764-829_t